MLRWLIVIFLAVIMFSSGLPWLEKLGIGRLPGDFHFRIFGHMLILPFGSIVLWSAVAFLIAEVVKRVL